jgi:hypothetical protein
MSLAAPFALALAVLAQGGALGVGLVFLGAAREHWRHRGLLAGVVGNYRLLPGALIRPVAMALPVVELALAACLLAVPFGTGGLALAAGLCGAALLLVFALAMAINLRRGRGFIDCGCGHAALRQPLHGLLVLRNLVLALPLLALGWGWVPLAGLDLLSALAGGVAVGLGYNVYNALVALLSSPLSASLSPLRR